MNAHEHRCEMADKPNSWLRSPQCQITFSCNDEKCNGKRYCPPCLTDVATISAEIMGDW